MGDAVIDSPTRGLRGGESGQELSPDMESVMACERTLPTDQSALI